MKRYDWEAVFRLVSDFLYAYGTLLLLPFGVAIITADSVMTLTFGIQAGVILLGSHIARRALSPVGITQQHAIVALAITWSLLSLFSSVPFVVAGMPWIDALFESFSAWTDTGLTMIPNPALLPSSLAVFRLAMQWVSGLGIVMFVLCWRGLTPHEAQSLFQAEGRFEDFTSNLRNIGRVVVTIYTGYTLAGTLALWALGIPFWEALAHAVTSLSTGGFSTNSVGVGVYGALPSLVAMILMLAGGISFGSHYALLTGKVRKFWRNPEVRILLVIVVVSTTALALSLRSQLNGENRVLESAFYAISAITTCGAGTTLPLSQTSSNFITIMIVLMLSGAVYGSTSGALKLWRLIILGKVVRRKIHQLFRPEAHVETIHMGNNVISNAVVKQVGLYMILYLLLLLGGALSMILLGYTPLHAFFTIASAQGNVGLNAMPDALYFGMPVILKVQLIVHMLLGRMEILPMVHLLRALRRSLGH
ncbi:MAG: TrkH family potassium uptake protein [Anaerolineae bacterium]